jgi:hypothetical protein
MLELRQELLVDGRQETLEDLFFRLTETPHEPEPSASPGPSGDAP